ncbi:DUF928 domain-containing protein [Ancylothrix sp. C2]|uniref:DUF928 domain-containing protein n=1 Tax=Ancylothrix sp. D3o TaxID=2953691 RepID=UPI0021BB3824|nr:DUF928 domain-containing protein [Ancylothrix sp. D3o]MCT7952490.1 DUF928 domain-containing protein [Ancylothrix sp. D3o]
MFGLKTLFYASIFALFSTQIFSLSVKAGIQPQDLRKLSQEIPEPAGPGTPRRSVPGGTYVRFEPPAESPPTRGIDIRRQFGRCPGAPTRSPDPVTGAEIITPSLTPLLPPTNIGLTYAAHPTFFIYIPPASLAGQLILQDEAGNDLEEIDIPVNEKGGVIGVTLPKNASPLEIGKNYRWFFVLVCDPKNRENDRTVSGWIKRIEINPIFKGELEKAKGLEQPALYAQNGIWFETLSSLAQMRLDEPTNPTFTTEWEELLKSVGLQTIAEMPLIAPQ